MYIFTYMKIFTSFPSHVAINIVPPFLFISLQSQHTCIKTLDQLILTPHLYHIVGPVEVLSEDGGRESVLRVIGALDQLLHVGELDDLLHGAEDLGKEEINIDFPPNS